MALGIWSSLSTNSCAYCCEPVYPQLNIRIALIMTPISETTYDSIALLDPFRVQQYTVNSRISVDIGGIPFTALLRVFVLIREFYVLK